VLPNKEPTIANVRECFEEAGLALTVEYLTMLRGEDVRVPLPDNKTQCAYLRVRCLGTYALRNQSYGYAM
jgi:8-oxo-dGTP pyrophosphatase MutT (NUDIX family)